jgi:flavin reductase (DIM6/NTAB) family NADH-FMN oxidoreductase RutF
MPSVHDTFNALMGELDYPMFIVTALHEDEQTGCLVGFATQCSIEPSRFLVCISKTNHTFRAARAATAVAVHFVPADATELAELFGGESGDDVDKFSRCAWHPGPDGVPLLEDCPNRFVGAVRDRVDFGDHLGLVLEPTMAERGVDAGQFDFHRAKRIDPGHPA